MLVWMQDTRDHTRIPDSHWSARSCQTLLRTRDSGPQRDQEIGAPAGMLERDGRRTRVGS